MHDALGMSELDREAHLGERAEQPLGLRLGSGDLVVERRPGDALHREVRPAFGIGSDLVNRSTTTLSTGWADLDMSGTITEGARFAILQIQLTYTAAAASDGVYAMFRKNGSSAGTVDRLPTVGLRTGVATGDNTGRFQVMVPLDASRICEYQFLVIGSVSVQSMVINVVGAL